MKVYNVIKNTGPSNVLVWKFPGEDFINNSQLIVTESEEALFVKDGVIYEKFQAGRYTLSTNNFPFISDIRNTLSGRRSPFSYKIYYVSKVHKTGIKWETDSPMQLEDPVYHLQTSLTARGNFTLQVINAKQLLRTLVGYNAAVFSDADLEATFQALFLQYIKDYIPNTIKESGKAIKEFWSEKETLATGLLPILNKKALDYGIRVVDFHITSLDVPEADPYLSKLNADYYAKSSQDILGGSWEKIQIYNILRDLANNPSVGLLANVIKGLSERRGEADEQD